MPERTVIIASTAGLHARPANTFVQAVQATGLPVRIGRPGEPSVDASSILSVMGLAAAHGTSVVLSVEGEGAETALAELATVLETDLDAEPVAGP